MGSLDFEAATGEALDEIDGDFVHIGQAVRIDVDVEAFELGDDVRRFFLAGGGNETRLSELLAHRRSQDAAFVKDLDKGVFVGAGASVHYLISGRKG